ncbi:hypothetical protein CONPUDRAFT_72930 [Coniophora puteana RWD-64-598 SS2]|uniref:Zn(2)-C6 fungal-type domain-containing protein n=1 Tax=Coniophora puteana (strain RWD-64-598) TaxID=741705 RepID=A0A5M3MPY0_CONPW|nr:uncharacterized protein CONPUDRAFT_72930 [Coniophora puteana RWD-64-598 SS2]EIW81116.1 hypothetical protein CONPUDRAFT_72930 [Coniophora puteana RWD-64-598 SS2]
MPPEATQSIKKRLPACDSCKLRRIRCFPVAPPDACSCCKTKGIACTTTPVIRKKPTHRTGKRIEIARAVTESYCRQKFGTVNYASRSAPGELASRSESSHKDSASPSSTVGNSVPDSASTLSSVPPTFVPSHDIYVSSTSPQSPATRYPVVISIPSSDETEASTAGGSRSSASPNGTLSRYRDYANCPLPYLSAESDLINIEFSGTLLADLLYSGRRLGAIPPVSQALVLTVAAMTARLSSNPVLFGGGRAPPTLSTIYFNPNLVAAEAPSAWGRRREEACEKFRNMAIEKAWSLRIMKESSPQSLAICFILQFLADNLDSASDRRTWGAAFVQQLRVMFEKKAYNWSNASPDVPVELAISKTVSSPRSAIPISSSSTHGEPDTPQRAKSMNQLHLAKTFAPPELYPNIGMREDPLGVAFVREPNIREMGLRWCLHIMRESVIAATRNEICIFTMHDEAMLAGPPPPSPEEAIVGAGADLPWWDFGSFLLLVRPFTYRATQLALDSTQWQMHRFNGLPFSTSRLDQHLSNLTPLHALLSVAQARYSIMFDHEALALRYQALHQNTPDMSNDERNVRFWSINRNILFAGRLFLTAMKSALGSLNIPIYLDLQARIEHLGVESQEDSGTYPAARKQVGDDIHQLKALLGRLRMALLPYARGVVHDIQWGSNLGWITHLGNEPMRAWASIILDSTPIEDGGEGVTRAQRVASLETLLNIFKILTWSWPRVFDDPLVQRTQQVVEEGIRRGVYGSGSMHDHIPRTSYGLYPSNFKDKHGPSTSEAGHGEDSGIWPSYLGSDEARRAMAPMAAAGLKTVHHADAIPPMPWPKVHNISPELDVPDIQQMMRSLSLHDTPASQGRPAPFESSPLTAASSLSVPLSNVAFDPIGLDITNAMFEGTLGHGQASLQGQAQALVQMQMPDLCEFNMAAFGESEGPQEMSIPHPSFGEHTPSYSTDQGFDMQDFVYPQPPADWTATINKLPRF